MRRVYIKAYCQQNLGDDLFVQALVRRYPNVSFRLFATPSMTKAFYGEPNLKFTSSFEFFIFRILRKLKLIDINSVHQYFHKKYHVEIRIGGSIFIEPSAWSMLEEKDKDHDFADFYIGANFGPYRSQSFFDTVKEKLERSKDCCFRDTYSQKLFDCLPNVRYAPDVLLGYKYLPKQEKGNGLGISVISLDNRSNLANMADNYYRTIGEVCNFCIEQKISVSLFSFCNAEGDRHAIDEILKYVDIREKVDICEYTGDTSVFLSEMNKCEYVLATRFHAMILGWAMEKKVMPILYSDKQRTVIDDFGYNGPIWDLLAGQNISVDELIHSCFENKKYDISEFIEASEMQFAAVDDYLNAVE